MKTPEQTLFELLNETGELLEGEIHIIDISDSCPDDECSYRVYHKKGYCFDIKKIANYDIESGEHINFEYSFYAGWDGFSEIDTEKAIQLVKDSIK
jgi:hypothetical protein